MMDYSADIARPARFVQPLPFLPSIRPAGQVTADVAAAPVLTDAEIAERGFVVH
jgi:hypothetical protein